MFLALIRCIFIFKDPMAFFCFMIFQKYFIKEFSNKMRLRHFFKMCVRTVLTHAMYYCTQRPFFPRSHQCLIIFIVVFSKGIKPVL